MKQRQAKLLNDVTRGNSPQIVKKGRIVNVMASRLEDGIRNVMVRIGQNGRPFVISITDMEYIN